jgi:hypothetical protein
MKETFKILSGIVECPCKQGGYENAHITQVKDLTQLQVDDKYIEDGRYVQIVFSFECGHMRTDHYHFHKGTTHCETQYIFDSRDCAFPVTRPKHRWKRFNLTLQPNDEANDGTSV